ncbi:M20 family metallopeptidase [Corynebacterium guangdongense]|uniref:Peptidase M20 domain-containing protein 2 n=1 Tax=Corynebacterium guangdongense TaxID=1783348 RepID=A0ABU2A1B2_9CORY|nr:M20 family metallopeptidase [Corynebacterium guangdongense]MDR7330388.1 amidohydrolase [Corynebacterium guangdongense]WJZ18946.1 p-aminobenzoyl-glutamate hydrolase subunit B [Corynebacterium guangdongense]
MADSDPRLTPSTAFLEHTRASVARRVETFTARAGRTRPPGEDYPGQAALWAAIDAHVGSLAPDLTALAEDLHGHPETAFEEFRSRDALADLLRGHDQDVEVGVHGVATSLRAEWAAPGFDAARHPTVAVMSEYDALPGIGHACGHNIIAAAGAGAYLAAVRALAETPGAPVRVSLLGTPAEEGHSGKEYMIRGGMLTDVDAAVMVHPFSYDIASHTWIGRRVLTARYRGVPAHASSQPFMGRNALDAATLAYQGIGLMRQQMPPSDRVHAVISDGGERPSVVPGEAELTIYVRSQLADALQDLSARVDDILRGAALMAGVAVEIDWDPHPASLPIRNNQTLARRWAGTQARLGRVAMPGGIVPDSLAASTDFGNVSHLVPGIHPMVKVAPESVALHTEAFERCSRGPAADRATLDSAAGLAQVVADLARDPDLLADARKEFDAAGGPVGVDELFNLGGD